MANPKHVKVLTQGVEAWNQWRKKNPDIVPDLNRAAEDQAKYHRMGAPQKNTRKKPIVRIRYLFAGETLVKWANDGYLERFPSSYNPAGLPRRLKPGWMAVTCAPRGIQQLWNRYKERGHMTVMFALKVHKDTNKVQVLMLCPECREELDVETDEIRVRFRCDQHGKLGMTSVEEFTEVLEKVQRSVAEQHGLGQAVRINFIPVPPPRVH
jgi:hypothetical protein